MERCYQKRRFVNINIKKDLQLRILSSILLIVIISSLVSGGIFYHYSNRKIDSSYKQFHVQLSNMRQVLTPWIFLAIGLGASMALVIAVFYPKKIAGPVYRLEKRIREIAAGDLKEDVRLRSNDELQDLADEINQMGARLRERLLVARRASYSLDTIIQQDLRGHCSEEIVRRLHDENANLKKIFDEFNL